MRFLFVTLGVLLSATLVSETAKAARPEFDSPFRNRMKKVGDLKPTFYWIAMEKADGESRIRPLKDMAGNVLAMVTPRFETELRMEGTGKMLDGRIINYDDRVRLPDGKMEIRWLICPPEAPYGYGVDRIPLVPFRSVAVDPTVVPIGSSIYIPLAVGAKLPDGTIHDGMFKAVDIGSAIKNKRIDMFTEFGDKSYVFRENGMENMKAMEVFIIQ
jgi:3D (Asp-Asp-Asp) domain-containing protein